MGLGCVLRGWGGEGGAVRSSYEGEHEVIFFFLISPLHAVFSSQFPSSLYPVNALFDHRSI